MQIIHEARERRAVVRHRHARLIVARHESTRRQLLDGVPRIDDAAFGSREREALRIISFANVSLIDVISSSSSKSSVTTAVGLRRGIAVEAELHAVDVVRRLVHAHRGDSVTPLS